MFYYETNRILRHYIAHRPDNLERRFKSVYMFVENLNNIVSLNEDFYEYNGEESITGKNIIIAYEENLKEYDFQVWDYISQDYKFNLSFINFTNYREMNWHIHNELVHGKIQPRRTSLLNDFPPTMSEWYTITVRQPEPEISSVYFVQVFESQIWWAILFTVLAVVLFSLAYKLMKRTLRIDLSEIILSSLGVANMPSYTRDLLNMSYKISQFSVSIFSILMLTAFGTFLLSAISVRNIHVPFNNLDELFYGKHNYIPCVLKRRDVAGILLINTYNYSYNSKCGDEINTFDRFCLKNTAFLTRNTIIHPNFLKKLNCDIVQLPQKCFVYYRTNLLAHAFRHTHQLKVSVIKMRTTGVMIYTYKKYRKYVEMEHLMRTRYIEPDTTVYFEHIVLILIGYGTAVLAALIIFLIEICVNRYKMSKPLI